MKVPLFFSGLASKYKGKNCMSIFRRLSKRFQSRVNESSCRFLRRRKLALECLDPRLVLSASPFGAMTQDTGEYLLGSTAVTVVLMESAGAASTEDWDVDGIAAVKAKIDESLQWWQDTIETQSSVHRLSFTTDYQYSDSPIETSLEPIAEKSNAYTTWVNHFLDDIGANTSDGISADVRKFNHTQRVQHGTDWAFTIFVVNDENDSDGMFAEGGSFRRAFAFAGGRYMVVPANRPASSFAHELGHMFWARDEYPGGGSYTDRRGYYNAPNLNAHDNPTEGFVQQPSIMSSGSLLTTSYTSNTSSPSSFEMLGWKDSDEDGVFDVLDVPHTLIGMGQQVGDKYHFEGVASVNTLLNHNSSGFHSDITINDIDVVEYRFDDGNWVVASMPEMPTVDMSFEVTIPAGASQIEVRTRTIDEVSQQTVAASDSFLASVSAKTVGSEHGLAGFVWEDVNANAQWDNGESGVVGMGIRLIDQDGSPLVTSFAHDADSHSDSVTLNSQFDGIQIAAIGTHIINSNVYSRTDDHASTGDRVFANFNAATNSVAKTWGVDSRTLRITFDTPQSAVSIEAIADDAGDVARLEAYDAQGHLLERITSGTLMAGENALLSLLRPTADMAYVIARAHYNTEVLFDNLIVGEKSETITGSEGEFRFAGLPSGDYRVEAGASSGQQFGTPAVAVRTIVGTQPVTDIVFGLEVSPWLNRDNPEDINGDGIVSPIDALIIINDLNQHGARELPVPTDSVEPPPYLDASGDGWVTSIDALRVINLLNSQANAESAGEGEANWKELFDLRNPMDNQGNTEIASGMVGPMESIIQWEPEHDYLYHCQAADLALNLWVAGNDMQMSEDPEELE